ncbi:MAG: PilZ domain-containing protein [Solirubrobacteraceae bacterium]
MPEQTDIAPSNVRSLPGSGQGTLTTAHGDQLPVRTFERGQEVVLVVLVNVDEHEESGLEEHAELEYTSVRGVVKLHGRAVFEDRSLIRFRAHGDAEVTQRRSFVRVTAPRAVTLDSGDGAERRVHTVDLSGGGMLLSGPDTLGPDQGVRFSMSLTDGELPILGTARVVRVKEDGKCALVFDEIEESDRQRLIRFVFQCMRNARAKTRGDWS